MPRRQFISKLALLQRNGQVKSLITSRFLTFENNWINPAFSVETLVNIYVFAPAVAYPTLHESIC